MRGNLVITAGSGRGAGKPGFPILAVYAPAPHTDGMNILLGRAWPSQTLPRARGWVQGSSTLTLRNPNPPAGGGIGKPGFPIPLRDEGTGKPGFPTPLLQQPMFTLDETSQNKVELL